MKLIEVKPPYETGRVDSDENNDNVWNVELWNKWLESVDFYRADGSLDLISTHNLEARDGHRGVTISEIGSHMYTWYYNIIMGYKIEEEN
jgi:hypothetical protein